MNKEKEINKERWTGRWAGRAFVVSFPEGLIKSPEELETLSRTFRERIRTMDKYLLIFQEKGEVTLFFTTSVRLDFKTKKSFCFPAKTQENQETLDLETPCKEM